MDTAVVDPLVGRVLGERYHVVSRLARGGMATVYVGHDSRLDRAVALKVMHASLAEDEEFVERFWREARSAARLASPYVVEVYDQGVEEPVSVGDSRAAAGYGARIVYLVMELVRGRTLRVVLAERGRLAPADALAVLEPVAGALAAAHAAGLVHRDVKPENVLVADDGRIKVADFGLARAVESDQQTSATGVIIGTVGYLSPERVQSGRADARSDVYAAGVLLFELLTGRQPFDGDSPLAVAYRHVHERVPAPSEYADGVPPAIDDLVLRATAPDPDARPPDGAALLAQVRRVRDNPAGVFRGTQALLVPPGGVTGPPVARPGGRRAARDRPPRRNPWWRSGRVIAAALVALCLVIGVVAWQLGSNGRIRVPTGLVGAEVATAQQKLTAAGLSPVVDPARVASTVVGSGKVAQVRPGSGASVPDGGTVHLVISSGPPGVAVPDVGGQTPDDAAATLQAAGFTVGGATQRVVDSHDVGTVARTDPAAGASAPPGSSVSLVLSAGDSPVQIPDDLVGRTPAAATTELQDLGLTVRQTQAQDPDTPAGQVAGSDPAAGESVAAGSTVTITVSTGPGDLVKVPSVTGKRTREAERILRGYGLKADSVLGNTLVITQDPAAGSKVPRGTVVTLVSF